MPSPQAPPPPPANVPGRTLATLATLATALVAALFLAPPMLAAIGPSGGFANKHLAESLRKAFVEYWSSGNRDYPPALQKVVDYWFRFHVAKGVIAVLLLIVLIALGFQLWKTLLRATALGMGKRTALASAGVLVTMLAVLSLVTVMANIQGVAAPFSSLFPMLVDSPPDGELAGTLQQVRQQLADTPNSAARTSPALDVMISDFGWYHVAMAVIAATVAATLVGPTAALWTKFARTLPSNKPTRRVLASFATLSALLSLALILDAVGNTTVASAPTPALAALFNGGW